MMKQTLLLCAVLAGMACSHPAYAQDSTETAVKDSIPHQEADTATSDTAHFGPIGVVEYNKGKNNQTSKVFWGRNQSTPNKSKNIDISYLGFELGLNNYSDRSKYGTAEVNDFAVSKPGQKEAASGEFSLRTGKSVNVNIWPVWVKVNLIHHYLSLKTGFGIEMNNYRYSKNITYVNDVSKTYVIQDSVRFKKDKLFTEYLTIPVMLNFETNPFHKANSFRVSVGPTFGYLVKSRTKQVSSERGKRKHKDSFNLEDFRTGMRAELGFGPVTLYSAYSFTPIHQYGLKQYPFSIGIELIGDRGW